MADAAVLGEVISKEEMSDPQPKTFNQMSSKLSELMKGVQETNPANKLPSDPVPSAHKPKAASKAEPKNLDALKAAAPKVDPVKSDALIPEITAEPIAPAAEELPASIKTPKAAEEFAKVRTQRDEWKTKAEAHEAALKTRDEELTKLREAAKNPTIPDEVKTRMENAEKELEEYRKRLRESDLERDPQFESYFKGGLKNILTQAESLSADKGTELSKLIQLPDSEYRTERILAIHAEMDGLKQAKLAKLVIDHDNLMAEKQSALANNSEHLKQMAAQRLAQSESQTKETVSKISAAKQAELSRAREHLQSFKAIDGDEAHNSGVKEREAIVDAFFDGKLPPDQVSKLPIWAVHGMYLQKTAVPALLEQVRRLTEQVKGFQASSPAINGTPSKANGSAKDVSKMSFTERFKELSGAR